MNIYFIYLVGSGPIYDIADAVSGEENHDGVPEPYVIFDAWFWGEPNERQNWGASANREEEERTAQVSN